MGYHFNRSSKFLPPPFQFGGPFFFFISLVPDPDSDPASRERRAARSSWIHPGRTTAPASPRRGTRTARRRTPSPSSSRAPRSSPHRAAGAPLSPPAPHPAAASPPALGRAAMIRRRRLLVVLRRQGGLHGGRARGGHLWEVEQATPKEAAVIGGLETSRTQ